MVIAAEAFALSQVDCKYENSILTFFTDSDIYRIILDQAGARGLGVMTLP